MQVKEIIDGHAQWLTHPDYDEVKPLVTVILPTYSRAKSGLLRKCLDSVLRQSFRRLELIIVDDASVDGTFDICQKYMKNDKRVSIIRHTTNIALPAVSTYEAYLKARGEYIAYAFDDNQWELDALAKTFDFMEENGVKASYGISQVMDPELNRLVMIGNSKENMADVLWSGNCVGAGAVVFAKEVLETVGLHDPHLSLTRVCNRDLWLRIVDRFEFVGTGILFTTEFGITQPDSLGNSFKLDQWFFREHQQRRNRHTLLPRNYGECDVIAYTAENSPYFLECLREHYQQYRSRVWFSKIEWDALNQGKGTPSVKRILVICDAVSASIMMFTRDRSVHHVFCIAPPSLVLPSFLAMADVVVAARGLSEQIFHMLTLLEQTNTPCYYFIDDNFREAALDSSDPGIRSMAKMTTAKNLKRFDGLLVSSKPLQDYFLREKLHSNVILLGAVYSPSEAERPVKSKAFTVGFMGGPFRTGTLKICVLPALRNLAKEQPIRLMLPCTPETEEELLALNEDNLEIIPFFRTFNYEFLLNSYRSQGIDVLVHCGYNIRNNLYKTKNALLNAVSLGAVLVVSNIEPYCNPDPGEPENDYLLTRNSPEAWEEALRTLADDPERRATMLQTAQAYCETHYASSVVWAAADEEFSKYPNSNFFTCLKRYDQVGCWIMRNNSGIGGISGTGFPAGVRPYIPEDLSYTEEFNSPRRFGFTPGISYIREIGLLFAVTGKCSGTVKLRIFRKGKREPLTENSLQMDALVENGYTGFYLSEALSVRPNELLYLEVTMVYEEKDGFVGLFEDRNRRTLSYRVFNRLGRPLPGKNALFIDCRS